MLTALLSNGTRMVLIERLDRIARDMRGRMMVHVKGRSDTLLVSDTYAYLFRQM